MKLKSLVIFPLVVAGVVYGGLKGYIHFKVKKQVDQLVATAAPFADIEYGSISSTLRGVAMVNDITVYPRGVNDSVQVDQFKLITPGLDFLLNGSESLQKGELPKRMGAAIQGARIDLKGRLAQMLEEAEAAQLGDQDQSAPGLACTLKGAYGTAQYRELGVDELVFDTEFSIERGVSASEMLIKTRYSLRGIEAADVTLTLAGVGPSVMSVALSTPTLKKLSISYRPDAGFLSKSVTYCAGLRNVDSETYVDQLLAQSDENYVDQLGFVPGPGIRLALKQLMLQAGEVRIVAMPDGPLDMMTLPMYRPEDWPGLFGMQVTVNEKDVTDLSFRLPEKSSDAGQGSAMSGFSFPGLGLFEPSQRSSGEAANVDPKPVVKSARNTGRPYYRIVERSEVKQLIGKNSRILTTEGKHRSGLIISVEKGVISLQERIHGGTLSTRVPLSKARKIEVLERG